ncbi:MAG: glycogen/starch synthase [Verrucomicrobia bacterium]|nr:glycogen/starch synthase [Verrucomicrobiota bacterium]
MATCEFAPFAKTGDLGDQIRTLALELTRLGHDITIVMPFFRSVREGSFQTKQAEIEFGINLGSKKVTGDVLETIHDGIQTFFIRRDEYYDRSGIYSGEERPYEDNAERFIFFSKAVIELVNRLPRQPEIIHCHDWTSALVPVFVRERILPFKTVLTIHDLTQQGSFWSFDFALTNLPGTFFGASGVEFYGRLNFLKGGILFADAVTMPGEADVAQALTPQHGSGLDKVLQENRFHLFGIPHGIDYTSSNIPELTRPTKNGIIAAKADARSALAARLSMNTEGLLLSLPIDPEDTDAFESIEPIIPLIPAANASLCVMGDVGVVGLKSALTAERQYAGHFVYDPNPEKLVRHLALAAADLALFPSSLGARGLTVLSALRYGTIPIVSYLNGIHQIVSDYDSDQGFGFIYQKPTWEGLWDSICRANELFQHKAQWNNLVQRAHDFDLSWEVSAKAFANLFAALLRHREAIFN